jgi:hypothetical protein
MRWRRAASCCWISSIRFFFAYYSIARMCDMEVGACQSLNPSRDR